MSKSPEEVKCSLLGTETIESKNEKTEDCKTHGRSDNKSANKSDSKHGKDEYTDFIAKLKIHITLAGNYHYGKGGVAVNIPKAYHYYSLAAEAGHAPSQYYAASLIWDYDFTNNCDKPKLQVKNPTENFLRFLTLSAEGSQGLHSSKFLLGKAYYFGKFGITQNGPLCFKYFNECVNSYPLVHCFLGFCYEQGIGTEKDLNKAFSSYEKGASLQDPDSMNVLGLFYKNGKKEGEKEIPCDIKRAIELFNQAIKLGSAQAKSNLGALYVEGKGTPEDVQKGLQLLHEQAEAGDVDTQKYLGYVYMGTKTVPPNPHKTFQYFLMAAKQGSSRSLYNVNNDTTILFNLYIAAVKKGDSKAFNAVGICYEEGSGTAIDLKQAFQHYLYAAKLGNTMGQFNVARCYEKGIGTAIDLIQARHWYQQSASQGDIQAEHALKQLERHQLWQEQWQLRQDNPALARAKEKASLAVYMPYKAAYKAAGKSTQKTLFINGRTVQTVSLFQTLKEYRAKRRQ